MSELDTFTNLPLQINPKSKSISSIGPSNSALESELSSLNSLHHALVHLDTPLGFPPPPLPVTPKLSAKVAKLRDAGNEHFRRGRHKEAKQHYTQGLHEALARPLWEPSQLCREEVATLYANRAQAEMGLRQWARGAVDAETSVEAKKMGNAKAWWRRGKCLLEMGRLDEAKEWIKRGLELEGEEKDLMELMRDIDARIDAARDTNNKADNAKDAAAVNKS